MSKQHCRTLQVERFFRQCRMLLQHCCRFWQQCCRFRQQCRTKFRPFDNVETNWTCSICFDFVERTKFYNRIVRHCCRLWQQSRMLLRHCSYGVDGTLQTLRVYYLQARNTWLICYFTVICLRQSCWSYVAPSSESRRRQNAGFRAYNFKNSWDYTICSFAYGSPKIMH